MSLSMEKASHPKVEQRGQFTNEKKPFIIRVSRLFNLDKAKMPPTSNYFSNQSQTPPQTLKTTNLRASTGCDAVLISPPPSFAK